MITMLLSIFMAVVFIAYVVYVRIRFGKLTSISASTYEFKKNDRYIFFAWLTTLAICNLFQGMGELGFWTSGALMMTGVTVEHSGPFKPANILHSVSAVAAIVLGALALLINYEQVFPIAILLVAIITLRKNRTFIWDVEVIAFATIMLGYMLK